MASSVSALVLTAQGAATVNGGDIETIGARGCHLVLDITVAGGSPTATFTLQGKDEVSGKYYTILASAALATVATTVLRVHPGVVVAANLAANDFLPKVVRVICVVGGSTPAITATAGLTLVR